MGREVDQRAASRQLCLVRVYLKLDVMGALAAYTGPLSEAGVLAPRARTGIRRRGVLRRAHPASVRRIGNAAIVLRRWPPSNGTDLGRLAHVPLDDLLALADLLVELVIGGGLGSQAVFQRVLRARQPLLPFGVGRDLQIRALVLFHLVGDFTARAALDLVDGDLVGVSLLATADRREVPTSVRAAWVLALAAALSPGCVIGGLQVLAGRRV